AMTSPVAATPSADYVVESSTTPLRIHRVVEPEQAADPFAPATGGGRWSPPGRACVYASLSPAGAMLEYLAHNTDGASAGLLLAGTPLAECNEPSTWRELPYRREVQQVGAAWLGSGRSLALRVPSALVDGEVNVLLDPEHPGYAAVRVQALAPVRIDPRLKSA